MIHTLTLPEIKKIFEAFHFPLYLKGDFNNNIFGIRNQDLRAGTFNDWIYQVYPLGNEIMVKSYQATTDPGTYWLKNPMQKRGCFILKSNEHYQGLWQIGKHRNKYRGLVQKAPCKGYRDNDLDNWVTIKPSTLEEGQYGINGHKSISDENTKASGGCQVIPVRYGWNDFIWIAYEQYKRLKINSYSYSIFESKDVIQVLGVG